jgi:preprotein translocase subunit YajC
LREINPALILLPLVLLIAIPATFIAVRKNSTAKERFNQFLEKLKPAKKIS